MQIKSIISFIIKNRGGSYKRLKLLKSDKIRLKNDKLRAKGKDPLKVGKRWSILV